MGYKNKSRRREYDRLYKQRMRQSKAVKPLHEQIINSVARAPEKPGESLQNKPIIPGRAEDAHMAARQACAQQFMRDNPDMDPRLVSQTVKRILDDDDELSFSSKEDLDHYMLSLLDREF